jgi:hypothetical protein
LTKGAISFKVAEEMALHGQRYARLYTKEQIDEWANYQKGRSEKKWFVNAKQQRRFQITSITLLTTPKAVLSASKLSRRA